MGRHRRHRSLHAPSPWPARVISAAAVAAVVLLGLTLRHEPQPGMAPTSTDRTDHACAMVHAFLELAMTGVSPPPNPTPEDHLAVTHANAKLAQLTETLRHSEEARRLGCR